MPKFEDYPQKTAPSNADIFVLKDVSAGSTKHITRGDLIAGTQLPADSVNTQAIANGAITTAKIGSAQVTATNIDWPTLQTYATGVITAATMNSTGIKTVNGVGFRPGRVRFIAEVSDGTAAMTHAEGEMTPNSQYLISNSVTGTTPNYGRGFSTTLCAGYGAGAVSGFTVTAERNGFHDDGFSINVTNAGSAWDIRWIAYPI